VGAEDDFNTTLQTIACADIVIKSEIPVMIFSQVVQTVKPACWQSSVKWKRMESL
jgi:hypothetical protein